MPADTMLAEDVKAAHAATITAWNRLQDAITPQERMLRSREYSEVATLRDSLCYEFVRPILDLK